MRICIPIRPKDYQQAEVLLNEILKIAKLKVFRNVLIELWLDLLGEKEFAQLIKKSKFPVIAVCRAKEERGDFVGSEKMRMEKLKKAVLFGAEFIDCGLDTDRKFIFSFKKICAEHGAKLIVSKHFWDAMPSLQKLHATYFRAIARGADIVKIAAKVNKWSDNAVLFEFVAASKTEKKVIAVGMGEKGKISRIGCPLLGSFLTYVALDEKSKTAEGQLVIRDLSTSLEASLDNMVFFRHGSPNRNCGSAQCREINAFQCSYKKQESQCRKLSVLHDRSECRHCRSARRAVKKIGRNSKTGANYSRNG